MNKILRPGANPQDETTTPKKEVITWNTWAEIEQSLSEAPLTTDEKINQLTDQVRNINNGLNELIELSKILIKWQIEGTTAMTTFIQSMEKSTQSANNNLSTIIQSQADNKQTLDILLKAEKDKILSKNLMSKLQNYHNFWELKNQCVSLKNDILAIQNINAKDRSWYTLLDLAIAIENTDLVELLLKFPEIEVQGSSLDRTKGKGFILSLLENHLSNKKK